MLRSYFAQKGGTRGQRGESTHGQGREHVKTPLPEKNPEHVCRHCQSSTCDTLLAEFARHAIEPGLPDGVVNDPMLENGFREASIVRLKLILALL